MRVRNLKILSSVKVLFESLVSVALIWHQDQLNTKNYINPTCPLAEKINVILFHTLITS